MSRLNVQIMLRRLSRLTSDHNGSTAIIFALVLPTILALIGLAIDVAKMNHIQARLQSISDAAAIAAARELSLPNSKISQIKSVVVSNIAARAGDTREPVSNQVDVDYQKQQVRVELEQAWVPFFAHFLDATVTPVTAQSTARLLSTTTKTCILALDSNSPQTIHLERDAVITANDCGIYSNSDNSQAIRLDNRAEMRARVVCAVGGVKQFKVGTIEPEPLTDCPPVPDPLAFRTPPLSAGCTFNDTKIEAPGQFLSHGTYCGGITITGDAEVTFEAGDYIIQSGPLTISNNAIVKGKDVAFYLVGPNAVIDCTDNATVSLSGRKTGPMAGLLFFEDRTAQLDRQHKISCANANELTGTIYLPRGILHIDPNSSVADESAYTAIIVNKLELDFGPDLVLNADYDATDVPVPDGLKSAGTIILTQ